MYLSLGTVIIAYLTVVTDIVYRIMQIKSLV